MSGTSQAQAKARREQALVNPQAEQARSQSPSNFHNTSRDQALPVLVLIIIEQVLEYLVKKGYSRTEQTLRAESANVDSEGRPIQPPSESYGYPKYSKAFTLIRDWADGVLEVYKVSFNLSQLIRASNMFPV